MLQRRGWDDRARAQFKLFLAPSTLLTYDRYVSRFNELCVNRGVSVFDQPTVIKFLCDLADASQRPRSVLNCASAALTHLFTALGQDNPMHDPFVRNLITALVKSGTVAVRERSQVIPVQQLRDLFSKWPDNTSLDIKRLRQKCITLLALAIMLRPSDIAPRAVLFSPDSCLTGSMTFTRRQVMFHQDNTATIYIHGNKNDTDRAGFEVRVQPCSDETLCPVRTLALYLQRTDLQAPSPGSPVFVSLRRPFQALSAQAIAMSLNEVLKEAGLYPEFTAKDFRPTGATCQIDNGVNPKTVMRLGRWKTETVFFDHYVHSRPPSSFSDNVLLS